MKNIKNSQPQTKFTGSYKKKQCNTNDVRTLNDLPVNWENLPIFRLSVMIFHVEDINFKLSKYSYC